MLFLDSEHGPSFEVAAGRRDDTVVDEVMLADESDIVQPESEASQERKVVSESKVEINKIINDALKSFGVYSKDMNALERVYDTYADKSSLRLLVSFIKRNVDAGSEVVRQRAEQPISAAEHVRWQAKLLFALSQIDKSRESVIRALKDVKPAVSQNSEKKDPKDGLKKGMFVLKLEHVRDLILAEDTAFFDRLHKEVGV